MRKLIFGGVDLVDEDPSGPLKTHGVVITSPLQPGIPERDVTVVNVPGRSGSVIIDNGSYKNIEALYQFSITKELEYNLGLIKERLYSQKGYQKLYDSQYSDFYRWAAFYKGSKAVDEHMDVFRIKFDCKPYWYAVSGDKFSTFEAPPPGGIAPEESILNPYFEDSRPIVRIFGQGAGQLVIGGQTIKVSDIGGAIEIDTELQDAYIPNQPEGLPNKNKYVSTCDFVLFGTAPGKPENTISMSGGITKIEIQPRWRTI